MDDIAELDFSQRRRNQNAKNIDQTKLKMTIKNWFLPEYRSELFCVILGDIRLEELLGSGNL